MKKKLCLVLTAGLMAAPLAAAEKGKPEITAQTDRSGGQIPAEQAALRFDKADLSWEIFPEREQISGIATLTFTARTPVDRLLLDLDRNLAISEIRVNDRALPRSRWSNPEGRLGIALPRPLARGESVSVRITYGGTPHVAPNAPWDGGFVWSKSKTGKPWMATAVQGEGCDIFWPCIDHPTGEPAVADLHITVPAGLAAPANGVLLGVDRHEDGRSTYNWRVKNPNTYAIALNVGPYEVIRGSYRSRFGNVIPLELWHLEGHGKEAQGLFSEFAPTLDFYESMIGPYPFGDEKLGVVETPHKGMEHQTMNAYGNGYAKAPAGFDWLFHHELAHEWFGNQLTNSDWDDFWLHEGFGAYMQPLYGQWRGGDFAYHAMMNESRKSIANAFPVVSGSSKAEGEVYDPKVGPGGDIYVKGAWILHTLRNLIGDAAFFDATRRLVYGRPDPRPGNFAPRYGSTEEFRRIVNEVADRDLGWFFDAYLREAALPELLEERSGDTLRLRWKTPGDRPFPLPVEVRIGDRLERVPMKDGMATLSVPAGAHVVIDPEGKVLRRSRDIEAYQAWQKAQEEQKKAAKKAEQPSA